MRRRTQQINETIPPPRTNPPIFTNLHSESMIHNQSFDEILSH